MGRRKQSDEKVLLARERDLARRREKYREKIAGQPKRKRGAPVNPAHFLTRLSGVGIKSGKVYVLPDDKGRLGIAKLKDVARELGVPPNTLGQAIRRAFPKK
jgi:hypothetical protein